MVAAPLQDPQEQARRRELLGLGHVAPLTAFVDTLRAETGYGELIPYFDPLDGGVQAAVLFLMEAPGPWAVRTGILSNDNPNQTARNFTTLRQQVGLDRRRTVLWNIVPWYIGSGRKIRPAGPADIRAGLVYLERLLPLLADLQLVVLVGRKAQQAEALLREKVPMIALIHMPHPSPQFVNFAPGNRGRLLAVLEEVRRFLDQP